MINKRINIILLFFTVLLLSLEVSAKPFKLVIDAGHGGRDYGALGRNSREKDINLGVALAFGKMVEKNMDNVKVVYTRNRDVYLTLQERANIANSCKGDLFVSIHTNSVAKDSKSRTSVRGSATYVLGLHKTEENLAVAKRENSVIALEKDYTTKYAGFDPNSTESYIMFELNQDKHLGQSLDFASNVQKAFVRIAGRKDNGVRQAGFWVLARTGMPAVLVELDFICNPDQEYFMNSGDGRQKLAKSLYEALDEYLNANGLGDYEKQTDVKKMVVKAESAKKVVSREKGKGDGNNAVESGAGRTYKVQFLTSIKRLPANSAEFKGLSPVDCYKDKGLYKYTYTESDSEKDALAILRSVKKKFKQAFIVEFKDGKRVK